MCVAGPILAVIQSPVYAPSVQMGVAQTKDKDKGQSVTLDLKEESLDKWFAEAKGYLKQIERLDLSRQELAELPPQIAKLVNLKFLQIYDNHLKAIPKEIGTSGREECSFFCFGTFLSFHSSEAISLGANRMNSEIKRWQLLKNTRINGRKWSCHRENAWRIVARSDLLRLLPWET